MLVKADPNEFHKTISTSTATMHQITVMMAGSRESFENSARRAMTTMMRMRTKMRKPISVSMLESSAQTVP